VEQICGGEHTIHVKTQPLIRSRLVPAGGDVDDLGSSCSFTVDVTCIAASLVTTVSMSASVDRHSERHGVCSSLPEDALVTWPSVSALLCTAGYMTWRREADRAAATSAWRANGNRKATRGRSLMNGRMGRRPSDLRLRRSESRCGDDPLQTEADVRKRVRALMEGGIGPRLSPRSVWGSPCRDVHSCAACGDTIALGDTEFEANASADVIIFLHRQCFYFWQREAAAVAAPRRPPGG
jgi:hypothetical protein